MWLLPQYQKVDNSVYQQQKLWKKYNYLFNIFRCLGAQNIFDFPILKKDIQIRESEKKSFWVGCMTGRMSENSI